MFYPECRPIFLSEIIRYKKKKKRHSNNNMRSEFRIATYMHFCTEFFVGCDDFHEKLSTCRLREIKVLLFHLRISCTLRKKIAYNFRVV